MLWPGLCDQSRPHSPLSLAAPAQTPPQQDPRAFEEGLLVSVPDPAVLATAPAN